MRIVQASSAAVYGDSAHLPCEETAPLAGALLSPYALQKLHAEQYANLYDRLHGIKSLALRYFNVYGPRQDDSSPYSGVISRFVAAYRDHSTITICGDGTQARDFIHVADVARANVLALTGHYHGVLNIATGRPHSLLNVLDYLQTAAPHPSPRIAYAPPRPGDIKASYAATGRAENEIGFRYAVPLEEGLRSLLGEALQSQRNSQ
jgi:UDP-glucose 4-epimerase